MSVEKGWVEVKGWALPPGVNASLSKYIDAAMAHADELIDIEDRPCTRCIHYRFQPADVSPEEYDCFPAGLDITHPACVMRDEIRGMDEIMIEATRLWAETEPGLEDARIFPGDIWDGASLWTQRDLPDCGIAETPGAPPVTPPPAYEKTAAEEANSPGRLIRGGRVIQTILDEFGDEIDKAMDEAQATVGPSGEPNDVVVLNFWATTKHEKRGAVIWRVRAEGVICGDDAEKAARVASVFIENLGSSEGRPDASVQEPGDGPPTEA